MALYTLSKRSNLNTEAYLLVGTVHNWMKGYACARHMALLVQQVAIPDGHHIQRKPTSHHKQLCTSARCGKIITSKTLSPISYVYGPACRTDLNQHLRALTLSPIPGSIFPPRNCLHVHSKHYTTGSFRNVSNRYHHLCAWKCGYRTSSSVLHVCTHVYNCRNYATARSSQFTWKNHLYKTYLESLLDENEAIEQRRTHTVSDNHRFVELLPVVPLIQSIKTRYEEFEELRALLEDTCNEMREMAKEDLIACQADIDDMESNLFDVLTSKGTMEDYDIMLEVSCGAGGQEAMLFAGEVLEMYAHFAASKGWTFHMEKYDKADIGGIRFGSASVSGHHVYDDLKFESGVHRVQRIPVTERASRLHTSTISVAIIPQPSEIDIVLLPKDLKVDTYNSSGGGGQHVNKTDSAVRITHLPTGTVAACQDTRSQISNRKLAMQMLRSRIYNSELQEQLSKEKSQRKLQIGNKERSVKIRTYNFNQDRITDHRLGKNYFGIENFMRGDASLGSMIDDLHVEARKESLEIILDNFAESKKKVLKRSK